jgi:hypothetical protein
LSYDQSSDVKGPLAVSVTNIPTRGESPCRGQPHGATDLQDGSLDVVGVIVGHHYERRLLGELIDSLKLAAAP